MNQDGRGEAIDVPNQGVTTPTRVAVLKLCDSQTGEVSRVELIPCPSSYLDALKQAFLIFQNSAVWSVKPENIILMLAYKTADGKAGWAGLSQTVASQDMWQQLVMNSSLSCEIGVFEKKSGQRGQERPPYLSDSLALGTQLVHLPPASGIELLPGVPKVSGHIEVIDLGRGTLTGYVSQTLGRQGAYSITKNFGKSLNVATDLQRISKKPGNILTTNGTNPSLSFLGAVTEQFGKLGKDSTNFAYLAATTRTPDDACPTTVATSSLVLSDSWDDSRPEQFTQSPIWSINLSQKGILGELVAVYANPPNGTRCPTYIMWNEVASTLVITGSLGPFLKKYTSYRPVVFRFKLL